MNEFIGALFFIFGTLIGSFLNVLILRLPQGQSLGGRSHCTHCGHTLSVWELVPLVSFLLLKGRCASCGAKISPRYFIIEAVTGALFALSWFLLLPNSWPAFLVLARNLFVISALVVVFVVDLEHYIILDSVTFSSLAVVTLLNAALDLTGRQQFFFWHNHLVQGLIGAAVAALPFFLLWFLSKGKWMGFGDVKLALLLGAIFGPALFAVNFFLAVFLGTLASIFLLLNKTKTLKSQIPFGTFLSLAAVITLYFGDRLLLWYLSSLGL